MKPKPVNISRFEEGDIVYLYVHRGSYSQQMSTLATTSFFVKRKGKEEIEYSYSFSDIPMEEGKFLYGYVCTYNQGTLVQLGIPHCIPDPKVSTKIRVPF